MVPVLLEEERVIAVAEEGIAVVEVVDIVAVEAA